MRVRDTLSTKFCPLSQVPMSCQCGIARAPRPRHIPSIPNISQAITARLRARWTSPHSFSTAEPSSSSSAAPSGTMAGLAAGVFLCSRAVRRHRAEGYSAFPGNDLMLSALTRGGRGPRRKELHDVFCEQGDDEDEDQWDERTSLRTGSWRDRVQDGFHEGFLDE
ncbi:hypothetical protein EDB85DRAFT_106292 [Lactarius pseudohatsudake]|nr:hypothetical protein EDB85DRAFT_106292 [Lactarius pseudohatsudake]